MLIIASISIYNDATNASNTCKEPRPCCVQPLKQKLVLENVLPEWPNSYPPAYYPGTTGFIYTIEAVNDCLKTQNCTYLPTMSLVEEVIFKSLF